MTLRRAKLLPELQEEIISTLWNSHLTPQARAEFLWSASLVNNHWKSTIILCAYRDYHFSSGAMYKWYIATLNRQYLGQDVVSRDLCRSITFHLYSACWDGILPRFDWSRFPASDFPNLHHVFYEDISTHYMEPEDFWSWLDSIPPHINSLHLGFVQMGYHDPVYKRMTNWSDDWGSDGVASIKHLDIEGMNDVNLAWDVLGHLFPNVAMISCDGHHIEHPPIQLRSITIQNIKNFQDYMSNMSKRESRNEKANRFYNYITQENLMDYQTVVVEYANALLLICEYNYIEDIAQDHRLAHFILSLTRKGNGDERKVVGKRKKVTIDTRSPNSRKRTVLVCLENAFSSMLKTVNIRRHRLAAGNSEKSS
ncbi:hypothetical protein BDQ17DRAFT_1431951 [Cyathus striatus]|nr:hypothetical protein BDQ17DRAFT_1431951 [Cyathus striatus]